MRMVFERLLSHSLKTCEFLDNEEVGRWSETQHFAIWQLEDYSLVKTQTSRVERSTPMLMIIWAKLQLIFGGAGPATNEGFRYFQIVCCGRLAVFLRNSNVSTLNIWHTFLGSLGPGFVGVKGGMYFLEQLQLAIRCRRPTPAGRKGPQGQKVRMGGLWCLWVLHAPCFVNSEMAVNTQWIFGIIWSCWLLDTSQWSCI